MNNSFFAMLGRMKYIDRWALMRNFRKENIGEHSLDVAGAKGGRIVVRAVVETLNYPPCCDSVVKENPS